jgi:hypothetical protein
MTEENKDGQWDNLLTEEAQDGEEYIQPNIELELPVNKRKDCRDIVMEIRKFGVSQRQMLYIIYLLSLELEDNKAMKAIVKAIGENRKNVPVSPTLERSQTPSLILPGKD